MQCGSSRQVSNQGAAAFHRARGGMIGRRRPRPLPPEPDGTELKWPGATNRVELFAQVIWAGVLTTLAGLAIITLPAAIAAGTRHLNRYLRAERSTVRSYGSDFLRALPGGLLVGVVALALAAVLGLNSFLAATQVLVLWPVILCVGILGLAATVVALLQVGFHWAPETGWKVAVREGLRRTSGDPVGGALIAAVAAVAGVIAWLLPPLVVAGVGCLLFTVLTVNVRPRRGAGPEPGS
ncbi:MULTISPECIES: hypothetical protein [unclassified Arthrobacter]|uniref:hypothetical protein n=1 Tax=unclassified Arthrobacter TaxID=235627 RepID=UPI0014916CCE|nr:MULTISPECIES: hypothetical protein [unclassified Arthrobacter]NOJ64307.1 hypothetical protein [Arthrobacter sp. 147(2020)]